MGRKKTPEEKFYDRAQKTADRMMDFLNDYPQEFDIVQKHILDAAVLILLGQNDGSDND